MDDHSAGGDGRTSVPLAVEPGHDVSSTTAPDPPSPEPERAQANEPLARLARGIAHEIGNLGQVVGSAGHLLADPRSSPELVAHAAEALAETAQRCRALVTALRGVQQVASRPTVLEEVDLLAEARTALADDDARVFGAPGPDALDLGAQSPGGTVGPGPDPANGGAVLGRVDRNLFREGLRGLTTALAHLEAGKDAVAVTVAADGIHLGPLSPETVAEVHDLLDRPLQGAWLDREHATDVYLADQQLASAGCTVIVGRNDTEVMIRAGR